MDSIRFKIWKNDLKILGSALLKRIKNLFSARISRVSNNKKVFPLQPKWGSEPLLKPIRKTEYFFYNLDAHDRTVILLSGTKRTVLP